MAFHDGFWYPSHTPYDPLYDEDKPDGVAWLVKADHLGHTQDNTNSRSDSIGPCASKLYHSLLTLAGGDV